MASDTNEELPQKPRAHVGLLRNTIVGTISQIVRLGASFLIGVIVARSLGVAAKGELSLLQQVPSIFALLFGLGISSASTYFLGKRKFSLSQVMSDALAVSAVVSTLSVVGGYVVLRYFMPGLEAVGSATIILAVALAPLMITGTNLYGVVLGLGKVSEKWFADIISALVGLAFMAVAYVMQFFSLETVIISSLITSGIGLVFLVGIIVSSDRVHFVAPSLGRIKKQAKYASHAYVSSLVGYLELRADIVLLGLLSTTVGVGIYSVGTSLAEFSQLIPMALQVAVFSSAANEEFGEGIDRTNQTIRITFAATAVLAIMMAIFAKPAIGWVYGQDFLPAAQVLWILLPGLVVTVANGIAGNYFAGHGRQFPILSVVLATANIVLNIFVIPHWGYIGAAVVSSFLYLVGTIYILKQWRDFSHRSYRDALVLKREDCQLLWNIAKGWIPNR